jgi:transcriptional regulator with XRE-family HTH domain
MSTKKSTKNPSEKTDDDIQEAPRAVGYPVVRQIDMKAKDGDAPESLLGDRIRYARTNLGLKIEALSRLAKEYDVQGSGISPTSISRYESGESLPGLREFRLIAESLDVSMTWLLYGTVDQEAPGISNEDFALLVALRTFVGSMKEDAGIGMKASFDWHAAQNRMERLKRAKKPQADDSPPQ